MTRRYGMSTTVDAYDPNPDDDLDDFELFGGYVDEWYPEDNYVWLDELEEEQN
jgi:hypothetical protein